MISPAITLALALVPSWLLVRYFHDRDRYPEPPRVIWTTFALGALTVVPVLAIVLPLAAVLPPPEGHVAFGVQTAFLYAAVPEEFFKLLVLTGYSLRRREFDEPMDGLVYGVVVSQGFAALENAMYSASGGAPVAIARAFTAVPAHACMGAVMGYYAGRARFEPQRRTALVFTGYVGAVLLHGLYDTPLMVVNGIAMRYGEIPEDLAPLAGVCILFGIAVLIASLALARRLWRKALREQIDHPVPPPLPNLHVAPPHPASIASPPHLRAATFERGTVRRAPVPEIKLVAGIALALFGGAALFSCVHALLDPGTDSGLYAGLCATLLLFGMTPLAIGLRLFRAGVLGLNGPGGAGGGPHS